MAEPLAVCLHAVHRAGPLLGRRVSWYRLGSDRGAVCHLRAPRRCRRGRGDRHRPMLLARSCGASVWIGSSMSRPSPMALGDTQGQGRIRRPYGSLGQCPGAGCGLGGASGPAACSSRSASARRPLIPLSVIVAKELELRGTFRFHEEFALAIALLAKRLVDVRPLISATLPFTRGARGLRFGRRPHPRDEGTTCIQRSLIRHIEALSAGQKLPTLRQKPNAAGASPTWPARRLQRRT